MSPEASVRTWMPAINAGMTVFSELCRSLTRSQFANGKGKENSMTPNRGRGIIDTPSNHSVDEKAEKLEGILQAKGVTLFALATMNLRIEPR